MSFAKDINTICTHADLMNELGSARALDRIAPDADDVPDPNDRTKSVRSAVYQEVLDLLATRVPPVREADMKNVSSLKRVVAFGTLARLYALAVTQRDDVHDLSASRWDARYREALLNLRVTTDEGAEVSTGSIEIERG